MGAKTCLVVQSQGDARGILAECPELEEAATVSLVASLFPGAPFAASRATALWDTYVWDKSVVAGCFPGMQIVIAGEVAVDRPSELASRFIAERGTTILHAMHSVVDWFTFAVWQNGRLVRSLSISPEKGVIEDIGERLTFEKPYWDGAHPVGDPGEVADGYPLPFHPLDLGAAALPEFFGFQLEGIVDPSLLAPERIRLLRFDDPDKASNRKAADIRPRAKTWWKFW